jgi:redox-sensitive bicupin YhaK (pirin superfamily)
MGPVKYRPGEAKGAPDHPHKGFETITYVLEGGLRHEDSGGAASEIRKGDVQWMTAGGGVVHSEMPTTELLVSGGPMHAIQIWVNLPKAKKLIPASYQDIRATEIPLLSPEEGVFIKLLSGKLLEKTGPAKNETPILYAHVVLGPGKAWATEEVPQGHTAMAYVISGKGKVTDTEIGRWDLAELERGSGRIRFENTSETEPLSFLLLAGQPLGEPVARMGPFVMNTRQELEVAYEEYLTGRMGDISRR